jgi:N-acetylmuramoyl-L-alanine amidase
MCERTWIPLSIVGVLITLGAVAQNGREDGLYSLNTVIVDAGHGGKDPGAVNKWGLQEKDITLAVALRLRDYLNEHSSYSVVMTRDDDTYPTLPERAQIANRYQARESLFVSVHCNASTSGAAHGAETYVYDNEASDEKAARVATRENAGTDFSLDFIFADLRRRAMAPFTNTLAEKIQDALVRSVKVQDRRVQRGPFYVLFYPNMPSVLVEIGFITNYEEQKLLASPAYQKKIAEAIGSAVVSFGRDTESWRVAASNE